MSADGEDESLVGELTNLFDNEPIPDMSGTHEIAAGEDRDE